MAYKPVAHLLAIAEGDKNQTRKALDDWYLADTKDYEIFQKNILLIPLFWKSSVRLLNQCINGVKKPISNLLPLFLLMDINA